MKTSRFPLISFLLTAGFGAVLVAAANNLAAPEVNLAAVRGPVVIGTNTAGSTGHVNVSNRGGGHARTIQQVVYALENIGGGEVRLLAGDYYLDEPVVVGNGVSFVLDPNANVYVRGTGAVGAFDFQGVDNYATAIRGGRFIVDRWADDQSIIRAKECRGAVFDGLVFSMGALGNGTGLIDGATTSSPMTFLELEECYEPSVRNTTFLGGKGATGILGNQGNGLFVESCRFTNEDTDGAGGTGESDTVRRKFYRCIDIQGQEYGHVTGARFWGLGDNDDEVDALILIQRSTSPTSTENGHFIIAECMAESIVAPKAIQLRGGQGITITGNEWGANSGPNAAGEATIHITGISGVDSGPSTAVTIFANQFHNSAQAGTAGAGIYAETVDGLHVIGNSFDYWQSASVINLRAANVEQVDVLSNSFAALSSPQAAMFPVALSTGDTNTYSGDLVFAGNRIHGMSGLWVYKSGITVTGSISGEAKPIYTASTISAASSDSSINDTASGLPVVYPGDLISIVGFTGTTANNQIGVVGTRTAAKITLLTLAGAAATFVTDAAGESVTVTVLTQRAAANTVTL